LPQPLSRQVGDQLEIRAIAPTTTAVIELDLDTRNPDRDHCALLTPMEAA
jgi:hypothetical protein